MFSRSRFQGIAALVIFSIFMTFPVFALCDSEESTIERISGGFFSVDVPDGWVVITAGACGDFAFVARDPSEPLRQVFYLGQVGPFYMTITQKETDLTHVAVSDLPIPWHEMPVVDPPTPGNLLSRFHMIADTELMKNFVPQFPALKDFKVVSAHKQPKAIQGGRTELVRGVFREGEKSGEGMFVATVYPMMNFTGAAGRGTAYGLFISGMTASREEFNSLQPSLVNVLDSFSISLDYVNMCVSNNAVMFPDSLKSGRCLAAASDLISEYWRDRPRSEDIMSEKMIDEILGRQRLYDPDTGDVYVFDADFYEKYDPGRNGYKMKNLQPLPDENYDLWMKPWKDGPRSLR